MFGKGLKAELYYELIDWLNGVLRHFKQYFSHFTATAHIIHASLGFTSTRLGSEVSCPRTLPRKKPRESSVARTQVPWIMSQTLYHWATWDSMLWTEVQGSYLPPIP